MLRQLFRRGFATFAATALIASLFSTGAQATSHIRVATTISSPDSIEDLLAIAYGNGKFVAVSASGIPFTAAHGITWNRGGAKASLSNTQEMAFGKNTFVKVGEGVAVSPDGITWTEVDSPKRCPTCTENLNLWSVTFGKDQFVAVGDHGRIFTSPDGQDWREEVSATNEDLYGIRFGRGLYVAFTRGVTARYVTNAAGMQTRETTITGPGTVLISTNGAVWIPYEHPTPRRFQSLAYGNGLFTAVGDGGLVYTSSDGVCWTGNKPYTKNRKSEFKLVAFVAGYFSAIALDGSIHSSSDGQDWSQVATSTRVEPRSVAVGVDEVVFVGKGGKVVSFREYPQRKVTETKNLTSASGLGCLPNQGLVRSGGQLDWAKKSSFNQESVLKDVAFGNGSYIAVGSRAGESAFFTTANGSRWTVSSLPRNDELNGIVFGDIDLGAPIKGLFVAVGQNGAILTSPDGQKWAPRITGIGSHLGSVTFANGLFVAVGGLDTALMTPPVPDETVDVGTILTSTDGANWVAQQTWTGAQLRDVAFGGGRFVAVGGGSAGPGAILVSSGGTYWSHAYTGTDHTLTQVAYGNGLFVAAGHSRTLLVSANGYSWKQVVLDINPAPETLTFVNNRFLMVTAEDRRVLTSEDGVTWVNHTGEQGTVKAVIYNDGLLMGVGPDIMIGTGWTIEAAPPPDGPCGQFSDVQAAEPTCPAIYQLAQLKVISGYADGTFKPEKGVTRAEFAKMLVVTFKRNPEPGRTLDFADTNNHWAANQGYLQAAVAMNAIQGFDGPIKTFQPEGQITRAQMIKIVTAAKGIAQQGIPPYSDVKPHDWFAAWAASALNARLIGPKAPIPLFNEEILNGDKAATRAEAAVILANALNLGQ